MYIELGIWCHIGSAYIGALSYADDITLLCPSIRGLNEMIVLCCEYAKEYGITFNPKKTACIKFGRKVILMNMCQLMDFCAMVRECETPWQLC